MTRLTHLQRLEAESIHILREVVAECERPVMLYSIGKDSSVMLHLAMKAFYPAKPPFPLLHVDTTWKFREMIAFRDQRIRELGLDLIVHTNADGLKRGISPIAHGSELHTDVMKTQGLRQALDLHGFDAAFAGARQGARILAAQRAASLGPQAPAPRALAALQRPQAQGRELAHLPAVQLDRARYLALHPSRRDSGGSPLFRGAASGRDARRHADHGG